MNPRSPALAALDPAVWRVLPHVAPDAADLPKIAAASDAIRRSTEEFYSATIAPFEDALRAVWQDPTSENASTYLDELRPLVAKATNLDPWRAGPVAPEPVEPRRIGPYEATERLGMGGQGSAFLAHHVETGQVVTLKTGAGVEPLVCEWLEVDLPRAFLAFHGWGVEDVPYGYQPWSAREAARGTLADTMRARGGVPLPLSEALAIFRLACDAVASLHARRVYRWSAHARNVFRVGQRWKLGDLGRCVVASSPDDPRYRRWFSLAEHSPAERSAFLAVIAESGPWIAPNAGGICGIDPDRERRLRLDDGAMLAGLLCDVLGVNRWAIFGRALATSPILSGRYVLTGDRRRDARLSDVLNRAWAGDGGGVLGEVRGARRRLEGYEDPGELRAAVDDAIGGTR